MGPVEFVVLAFPGEQLRVDAVAALTGLGGSGGVRPVDALVVTKTAAGEVLAAELTEFEELREVIGDDGVRLIGPEDVQEAAELLEPGSCALLVLVEHVWAVRAAGAVHAAGGQIAAAVRIPPGRLDGTRAKLAATAPAGQEA